MNWLRRKTSTRKAVSCFWMRCSARILVISMFISCGLVCKTLAVSFQWHQDNPAYRTRHLLSNVEWEKCDFEIGNSRNYSDKDSWHASDTAYAWLALYVFCVLIIFIAIAIVCDDFFVPSLEAISEKLDLSEDVAGATFMAAGSSAPELFTSVAGASVESDVGIGTIVGSAVFNLLVIIALTAALAGDVLQLDWKPLIRDSFCYALSIAMFIWFAWDGKFHLHEAVVLLVLYILYIVLMKFNSNLMNLLAGFEPKVTQVSPQVTEVTQFVSGEIETNGVLQGQHGTPAGKLPPIKYSETKVQEDRSRTYMQTEQTGPGGQEPPAGQAKIFSHAHRGELSRSFNNLSLGKSQQLNPRFLPRLSMSYPILRDPPDDPKAHRRSSLGFSHGHPSDGIRLKSIAAQQILKEYRRRSEAVQRDKEQHQEQHVTVVQVDSNGNAMAISPDHDTESVPKENENAGEDDDEQSRECKMVICPFLPAVSAEFPEYPEGGGKCIPVFRYMLGWILFILSIPFICMFTWTIPDCSKKHNRKYYLLSFLMSIVWIAILSFAMVTLVGRSGCILMVDRFTMGLVVVAIGTSVPDALSSILVARDGFGDMAVSNAIGSNVFDINLGLGLPFLIRILITKMEPIQLLSVEDKALVDSMDLPIIPHVKFGFILLFILVVALMIFIACRFQLKRKVGVSFMILYLMFVVYAYVQDIYCHHKC